MTIAPFGWQDGAGGGTPVSAANLEAMLAVAGGYVDEVFAASTSSLNIWSRTPVTTDYTAAPLDLLIAVTDTTVPRTITLANPNLLVPGQQVIIKDESGNAGTNQITVAGAIDGLSGVIITSNYGFAWLYCTGAGYGALYLNPIPGVVNPPVIS